MTAMPTLQDMLEAFPFAGLPPAWQERDPARFSVAQRLL